MYEGKIPFDQHGAPIPYVMGRTRGPYAELDSRYIWEDNKPFRAVLEFKRFERGRSAAHAIYVKADDQSWEATMFLTDFEAIVKRGLPLLLVTGEFEHVKRGTNYGVKLIEA